MQSSTLEFRAILLTKYLGGIAALSALISTISYFQVVVLNRASADVMASDFSSLYNILAAYIGLLVLGSLARAATSLLGQGWEASSLRSFGVSAAQSIFNHPLWSTDQEACRTRTSVISGAGMEVTTGTASFLLQLILQISTFLGTVVGVAYALSPNVASSVGIGAILGVVTALAFNPIISRKVRAKELARLNIREIAQQCWSNSVPGNELTYRRWVARHADSHTNYLSSSLAFSFWSLVGQLAVAACVLVPISVHFTWLLSRDNAPALIVSTLVLLPRLIDLASVTVRSISMGASSLAVVQQLTTIRRAFHLPPLDISSRISWRDIRFQMDGTPVEIADLNSLMYQTRSSQGRRIRIIGANGCGKSTILRLLKMQFDAEAFIYQGLFDALTESANGTRSSGQMVKDQLTDVLSNSGAGILLLDEWSAHLDSRSVIEIDRLLDEACMRGIVIVEVLHVHNDHAITVSSAASADEHFVDC